MTWEKIQCHVHLTPEEIEEMKVTVDILRQLEDAPERFLMLFQPKFLYAPFWRDRLFEKLCKLVRKEATKEIASLEAQLLAQQEETSYGRKRVG